MGARIRALDWSTTPLGPSACWPQSLKTIVDLMLASPSMMSLVWGPAAIHLYNDSFSALLREHATTSLGRSAFETFARSRSAFEEDVAAGMAGASARLRAQPYPVLRDGRLREAWFDVDYAPVRNEAGQVAGVLWTLKEVTDAVLASRALRESDTRHRLLIDSWAQAIWETDADGVVVADSPSWGAYTGQTPDEARGYGWLNAVHPDDRAHAEQQWHDATNAGGLVNAEFRLRAPGGGWRWTNVRAAPVLNAAGQIEKWAAINIDIEDRKRAEAKVRESDERLRGVLDGMAEGFGVIGPDFTILEHNQEALRLDGRSREEIVGRSHWEAFPGTEHSEVGLTLKKAMSDRQPAVLEHLYAWRSDRALWLEMRVYPTSKGELAVFWRDITDRKAADEALRKSEKRYRSLFESMDEAYAVVDVLKDEAGRWIDFRFVDANPAFLKHTSMPWPVGKTATELLGSPNPRWTQLYGQALDTGVPIRVEEDEPTLKRTFDLNIFTLDQERSRVAVLFTDITERKRAEIALREREADLARVQRIGAVGGLDIDVAGGLTSRRSPEYLRLHGLPPDAVDASHAEWRARVHPADLEQAERTLFTALRGDARTYESEYRITRPSDGEVRWIAARADIERDPDGQAVRLLGAHIDITEQKLVQEALRVSEERLRRAAEVAQFGLWDWNMENGTVTWSDEHYRMQGYRVGEVCPSYEAWLARVHPDDRDATERAIVRARDSRTEYVHDFRVLLPGGETRWLSARARFYYGADNQPVRMIGAMLDTTERREWEERQKILLAELQHRVRNILAVIRSIVSRSNDGERSTEEYVQHLQGRLSALARTQVLLTRRAGAGVDLEDIIRDELVAQATQAEQFTLRGPDIELSPKAAEVLALAVHELATNATKYGAFSRQGSALEIDWRTEDRDGDEWLVLHWRERGVAIVDAVPRRQGFGTELISRRIPYELRGHGRVVLRPGGLQSTIEFPFRRGDSILQTNGVPV